MSGYIIAVWEDLEGAVVRQGTYENWVGWMPFDRDGDADSPYYINPYPAMERYLTQGTVTEVLEYHPHGAPVIGRVGERCAWWAEQLHLRDKEQDNA